MRAICLYLHIHQPVRYREYSIFDVGNNSNYYYDHYDSRQSNERIFKKVANKSYKLILPKTYKTFCQKPTKKIDIYNNKINYMKVGYKNVYLLF